VVGSQEIKSPMTPVADRRSVLAPVLWLGLALCLIGLIGLVVVWQLNARDRWYPAELRLSSGVSENAVLTFETPDTTGYEIELVTLNWQEFPPPVESGSEPALTWSVAGAAGPVADGTPTDPYYRVLRKDDLKARLKALLLGVHEGYPEDWWQETVLLQGVGRFRSEGGEALNLTVHSVFPDAWVADGQPLLRVRVRRQDWDAHLRAVRPWAYASALVCGVGAVLLLISLWLRRANTQAGSRS